MQREESAVSSPRTVWRKSSHSNPSGACVEVTRLPGTHGAARAGGAPSAVPRPRGRPGPGSPDAGAAPAVVPGECALGGSAGSGPARAVPIQGERIEGGARGKTDC